MSNTNRCMSRCWGPAWMCLAITATILLLMNKYLQNYGEREIFFSNIILNSE